MPVVHYPFMFDFKQPISGNGFLAGVEISGGRALMLQEEDAEWWMYGVFPGPISEGGNTPNECFLRYMEELKSVLFDFATEADSYNAFKKTVEDFCNQPSADSDLWLTAQKKLRAAKGQVQTNEEFIQKLPTQRPEERKPSIKIVRLDKPEACESVTFSPNDNVVPTPAMAA